MIGKLRSTVIDCPDPLSLAEFYSGILGGRIAPSSDENWVDVILPNDGVKVSFQRSEGYEAPRWPSNDGDQQLHLDIAVDDMDAAHTRLLKLGARHMEDHPTFRVYLDPVGHPFCTVKVDD